MKMLLLAFGLISLAHIIQLFAAAQNKERPAVGALVEKLQKPGSDLDSQGTRTRWCFGKERFAFAAENSWEH